MTAEAAFVVACAAAWLYVVISMAWKLNPHCKCCSRHQQWEKENKL